MPNYAHKETRLMFDDEFNKLMVSKFFTKPKRDRALMALLYYSGVRVSEAIGTKRKQLYRSTNVLYYDVGERLKHSKTTPALPIPFDAPHVSNIIDVYVDLEPEALVFDITRRTALTVVKSFAFYPHFYRANRITRFFLDGYTIPEVKGWTGLNVKNLEYYVVMASIVKMGRTLAGGGKHIH